MQQIGVIGGGPAGYIAAIKASQLGGRVILFEREKAGGACLNRGCIPVKSYIKTAEYIHHIRRAGSRGIILDESSLAVDMPRVAAVKDAAVRRLGAGIAGLLNSNGVEVVTAEASLRAPNRISAGGEEYEVGGVILCGGSAAGRIPIPGIEHPGVLTSDCILDLREIPPRLAVIGGGVIGCEFAAAFAAFGSRVTIIEALPRIAANMDADISRFLTRTLTGEGIEVLTETPLERIEDDGGKPVLCTGSRRIEVDAALLSVGRTADLSCLEGLEEKPAMKNGRIVTDEFLQTSIPGVWAAGDIAAGHPMLAHAASKMGECAAANALGDRAACDLRLTPSCIYTIPETASVGLAEEEAQREHAIMTGRFPLTANGRAVAAGETEGFVKVIADKANGEILGVHIAAAAASELIGEASALMAAGVRVQAAAEIIHAHPTVSEALMEACADACGCCLHLPPLRKH